MRAYNRVITASEIQALYEEPYTNPIGKWNFNGNANDSSGNGHHGTASNMTWASDSGFSTQSNVANFNGSNSYMDL